MFALTARVVVRERLEREVAAEGLAQDATRSAARSASGTVIR
jgi:hypothetical protein